MITVNHADIMQQLEGYTMKMDKSKISHIVALISIAMFIFVFYSFDNIANYIKYDFISEILFLLLYIFFLVFISLYTLKNHLKIEFAVFFIFSFVISNIWINESFLFFGDLLGILDQKQEYYMYHALFKLSEPYDLAPSIFGRIVLHIAPIIPLVFLIKMIGNKKSNSK